MIQSFWGQNEKKTEENENTLKKHLNIAFKNKVIRVDFFSFLTPNTKMLVFHDHIDYDLRFWVQNIKTSKKTRTHYRNI